MSPPRRALLPLLPLLLLLLAAAADALFCGRDNCYQLLSVPRNASKAAIRRAYRRLSAEAHPDKNRGDPAAADAFRRMSAAYEALLDDEKRAKYDDYLDNPTKYLDFLLSISADAYAPKANVLAVLTGLVGVATLVHWLNLRHAYRHTLRRLRQSRDFQQQVSRLVKSKRAATRAEAEAMIDLHVVGLAPPRWTDLLVFKLLRLPKRAFDALAWHVAWLVRYRIRKLDYSTEHKLYLIQRNMRLSDEQWLATSDKDRSTFLSEQLWQPDKCEQFMRMRRIQLNRLGKAKRKSKSASTPYSEPDTLNSSE